MQRTIKAQTGAGSSAWAPVDTNKNSFGIGFGVVVNGTVNYTVEHTFDDVYSAVTQTAFPHSSVAAQTTNKDGNYAFNVAGVRITVNSGSGTATLTMLQGES